MKAAQSWTSVIYDLIPSLTFSHPSWCVPLRPSVDPEDKIKGGGARLAIHLSTALLRTPPYLLNQIKMAFAMSALSAKVAVAGTKIASKKVTNAKAMRNVTTRASVKATTVSIVWHKTS